MRKGIDYPGISVSFFCHDGKGNYVLQKRSENCRDEHNRWDNGGGSIDLHDTVQETLHKEIREEYTTEPLEVEFLGYRDAHREHNGEKTHWIALDFRIRLDRSQVTNGEPHKFTEIGWFKLGEFPEPLHSMLPIALEQYQGRL